MLRKNSKIAQMDSCENYVKLFVKIHIRILNNNANFNFGRKIMLDYFLSELIQINIFFFFVKTLSCKTYNCLQVFEPSRFTFLLFAVLIIKRNLSSYFCGILWFSIWSLAISSKNNCYLTTTNNEGNLYIVINLSCEVFSFTFFPVFNYLFSSLWPLWLLFTFT